MGEVTLWAGGTVRTGRGDTTALAASEGRIIALGEEAESWRSRAAEVVDLEGGLLMPSFGDGHAHPVFGGMEAQGPPVRGLTDPRAIVSAVGRWADQHPEAEWIVGGSYDPAIAPGGVLDARWLDAAVSKRPVVLRAADYHTVWVNSEALRRAGITEHTPDPADGEIVRRPDGTPAGTLREWGAVDLVMDLVPDPGPRARAAALAHAGERYARSGITWYQDAWVEPDLAEVYLAAARAGTLATRVDMAQRADPERWREQLRTFPELRDRVREEIGDRHRLSARTVKFFADGVIESGTAALLEPYTDCPHSHGMPVWEPAALAEAVAAFDRLGFGIHIHAIGDAGIRNALDALEHARGHGRHRERRPVIAHTQLVDPDDLPRFRELGVVANFEPHWSQLDPLQTELTVPRLGERRAALQYPTATLLRSGVPISFGSDWPVSSERPLDGIQVAVTRRTFDGVPEGGWHPQERLTAEEALAAYTSGVAYQAGAEEVWGTLREGAFADLVWLDCDPRLVDPMRIASVAERGTWLSGTRVF